MHSNTFENITHLLSRNNATYRVVEHEPTRTSEESARVRGTPLSAGAKAILMKLSTGDQSSFALFVLPADRRVNTTAVKEHTGAKKVRFATTEELQELTGLPPGAVPPFGAPIFALKLYVDPALLQNSVIAFNAGSLTRSIVMSARDYSEISGAKLVQLAEQ